jgi:hypothetical protein
MVARFVAGRRDPVAPGELGMRPIGPPRRPTELGPAGVDRLYRRYGFPNDMLVHLNVWNARDRDYPSRPIYGVGERSAIKLRRVVPTISWLLKGFFWRMKEKYVIRDFHPLVFFYFLGFLMTGLGLVLGIVETVLRILGNDITTPTIVLVALLLISGSQFHAVRDVVRHGVEQGPRRPRAEAYGLKRLRNSSSPVALTCTRALKPGRAYVQSANCLTASPGTRVRDWQQERPPLPPRRCE